MEEIKQSLLIAEQKAKKLFKEAEKRRLIITGKSERQLNDEIVELASDIFGVKEFWHKKIVRAGINTLEPYSGNPPDLVIQDDDIVIVDFGPVFEGWEADLARTYVIGNNPLKQKIKEDVEIAWKEANDWFARQHSITGASFFNYVKGQAERFGYEYGGEIAGHIVGPFPHEQLESGNLGLDIHPDNHQDMFLTDPHGNNRQWILEMHFIDRKNKVGAFFEQLMN